VRPNTSRIELELDTKARKAIGVLRDFYRSRITYRRAVSSVNSHIAQVETSFQHLSGGGTYTADEARRLIGDMKKFDELSSRPSSAETDPEKRRILKERRKILRSREAQNADLVKNRREIIGRLEQFAKQTKRGKKDQSSKTARGSTAGKSGQSGASTTGSATTGVDYEQLFTETLMAVQKHLDDQEDLAETLSEAIEEIFKRHGVLVAA